MRYIKCLQCELGGIIKIGSVNGALTPIEIARLSEEKERYTRPSVIILYLPLPAIPQNLIHH